MKQKIDRKKLKRLVFPLLMSLGLLVSLSGYNQKVRVRVEQAVIRFDPSTDSSVVATVNRGDILDVVRIEGGWYNVTFTPPESGFLLSGFIMASEVDVVADQIQTDTAQTHQTQSANKAPDSHRFAFSKKVLFTTADFDYDYDIIGIITHIQNIPSQGRAPVKDGIENGMSEIEVIAIEMEGDAIVGLSYELFLDSLDNRLKVLIYGTVVRFK